MFAPCINSIKALFIIPNDTHNYKFTAMLKKIKIPTIAPTCVSSCGNHHQRAVSYLAKTTIMVLLCSSLMTWSMLWRHTSLLCKRVIHGRGTPSSIVYCHNTDHVINDEHNRTINVVLAKHDIAP